MESRRAEMKEDEMEWRWFWRGWGGPDGEGFRSLHRWAGEIKNWFQMYGYCSKVQNVKVFNNSSCITLWFVYYIRHLQAVYSLSFPSLSLLNWFHSIPEYYRVHSLLTIVSNRDWRPSNPTACPGPGEARSPCGPLAEWCQWATGPRRLTGSILQCFGNNASHVLIK